MQSQAPRTLVHSPLREGSVYRVVNPRPAGTLENSPAIHRWVVARIQNQSRQGRKNAPVEPDLFFRPAGALAIFHPQPTVETVGYFRSSLSGLWDPCSSVINLTPTTAFSRLEDTVHRTR